MNIKKKSILLSIVFTLLISSTVFSSPVVAADMTEQIENQRDQMSHYYDLETVSIGIIYDKYNGLTNGSAISLYQSLSLMTPDVAIHGVSSIQEFEYTLTNEYDIVIMLFQSDYSEMHFTKIGYVAKTQWSVVGDLLLDYSDTDFILAMGNSKQILSSTHHASNIHGTGEEVVDAKHVFIYALWTLSELLERKYNEEAGDLAEDIKMATMEYFAGNFNDLIQRNLNPSNSMGVEHPSTIEARKQQFYDEHPATVERVARDGYVIDPETNREIDPMTGELAPKSMLILNEEELAPSDFILSFLPEDSGLRGPVGGIVDELLGFLLEQVGDLIGLSGDTVESLATALLSIPDFIGAIKDPNSSKIKDFLDNLKPLIPIPADKMEYFDLIVDALFLLRGDFQDIQNFITGALELVVPDLGGGEDLVGMLTSIFNIGSTAINELATGQNFVDVIFSVLNEQIINDAIANFVNNITGTETINDITETIGLITSTFSTITNLLSSGNIESLIFDYAPTLLSFIPDLDSYLDSTEGQMLANATMIILTATGLVDRYTIADLAKPLFEQIFGINPDQAKAAVEGVLKEVSDFLEDFDPNDINGLKTSVFNALQTAGVDTSTFADEVDAIQEVFTLIVALKDGNFNIEGTVSLTTAIGKLLEAFGVEASNAIDTVKQVLNTLMAVISFIKNPPNIGKIIDDFLSSLPSLKDVLRELLTFIIDLADGTLSPSLSTNSLVGNSLGSISLDTTTVNWIDLISDSVGLIFEVIGAAEGNSIEGLLFTILQGGAYVLTQVVDGLEFESLEGYFEIAKSLFGTIVGWVETPPSLDEVLNAVKSILPSDWHDEAGKIISFILGIRDIFTGGFKTIFAKLTEWLAGLVTKLIESLTSDLGSILSQESWSLLDLEIPIEIGPFSLFTLGIKLGLKPGFAFDAEVFGEMIFDLVFKGISIFTDGADFGEILRTALSFFSIHPIFTAELSIDDFGSGKSSFISFLLNTLGLELSFSGSGFFELSLFSFKNGVFNFDDFFKVLAWGFSFTLTLSRTFTLLDFLTGGAGGSLNAIGKYIGLDAISITIGFTLAVEVIKRAATANMPETGSMTISLTIFFTVSLGIDILIAKLKLTGTLEITLTLLQDLVEPTPMRVFISIVLIITVTIGFLFWDWDFEYRWSPDGFSPEDPYELTPSSQAEAEQNGAKGIDQDGDGLSDEYERETPGLNPNSVDSDGDTLSDKFESQTFGTDPASKDTDQDGINDNIELDLKTNPLSPDTDFDGLSDYEEAFVIGTSPLAFDTDEDGLDDYYEVNHAYNMTGITSNVDEVIIGGVSYTDRTDPLNPDTDGDLLLDGEEGERGIYYGPELYNETDHSGYTPDPPLFFNGGYTHPLDNDTDDDSYEQLYDGSISPRRRYLRDMSDYTEIHGITVTYIDPETGEPETPTVVRTNPINPDSDGDTGVKEEERENPPFGFFLNSDGYELALDPPTDPLDGDSDDDGLIDGFEGTLRPDSNHSYGLNPDTDGDGLGDLQEFQLGTDPRSVDTDRDGVSDYLEFFVFGTSPFLADHDGDGLEDGEELWIYHSSPFYRDTDLDGLNDYEEVWIYFSDPTDDDTDNDLLSDWDEIFIHYTDPFEADTDGDGLFDGDEVLGLNYTVLVNGTEEIVTVHTDPLKWDTDGDSLLTLDQDGNISQSMSDGDEWFLGTRPDRMDTDFDGIHDGWELWLGKGKIPDFDPVQLDPLDPDSDDDTLLDGAELVVANMSTLLNPYIGFYVITPFNTTADNADTDGDTIPDNIELEIGTRPDMVDTDNDTLDDNFEVDIIYNNTEPVDPTDPHVKELLYDNYVLYNSDPKTNDSDGDGLNDTMELFGYNFPADHPLNASSELIFTQVMNPDSDNDFLPDGAEIYTYGLDPRFPDQNDNDIIDGMEIDSDRDGLMDGEEYYVYRTVSAPEGGGPFSPDSDRDGIFDGREVYETLTNATEWDSDFDTFSDGLEVACGTDPLDNSTTRDDFDDCFDDLSRFVILSPVHKRHYRTNAIEVIGWDPDDTIHQVEFRYKVGENGTYTEPIRMRPDTDRGEGYWHVEGGFAFPMVNDTIYLELTATTGSQEVFVRNIDFVISLEPDRLEIVSPRDGALYEFNEFQDPILPVTVETGSNFESVKFLMYNGTGDLLTPSNVTLNYEPGLVAFHLPEYEFPKIQGTTNYTLKIYALREDNRTVVMTSFFEIKRPTTFETILRYGGPVAAVAAGAAAVNVIRQRGFKNPFKKES